MQQQRREGKCAALRHCALNLHGTRVEGTNLFVTDASKSVGSGQHPKRPSLRQAFIKLHANSNQSGQDLNWWLNIENTFLFRPPGACGMLDPLFDRNAQVLVISDTPVTVRVLSKQRALGARHPNGKEICHGGVSRYYSNGILAPLVVQEISATGARKIELIRERHERGAFRGTE